MNTVKTISDLLLNSSSIRELFEVKIPQWESSPGHYDKAGWGFNLDGRFSASEKIPVRFDSWMGVYGDSVCFSQLSLDNVTFRTHLLKYLNAHCKEIMLAVADSIEDEARSLKEKAQAELREKLKSLEGL